jgi:GrpB-like predicted nucleotidyltransferase (UPF0157 family)
MKDGLKSGTVSLVKYTPIWKDLYLKERDELLILIEKLVLEIHHVGSTAIPNIYAKPIIDILIVFESEENLQKALSILEIKGYLLSKFKPNNHYLIRKKKERLTTHYIHLLTVDDDWQRYTLFRDYLINHKDVADEYQRLKLDIAKLYANDRMKYAAMKFEFVESVSNKARGLKR